MENTRAFVAPLRIYSGVHPKILEAIACQVLVITTSIDANGIGTEPNKHLLVANSANEYAGKLSDILTNANIQKQLMCQGCH